MQPIWKNGLEKCVDFKLCQILMCNRLNMNVCISNLKYMFLSLVYGTEETQVGSLDA